MNNNIFEPRLKGSSIDTIQGEAYYYITEIEDKIILVDTQGWHYIRYALVLYNYPINIKKTYKKEVSE